jgi:rod shape-determining protein MreC
MREFLSRHRFGIMVAILLLLPIAMMYFHGRRGVGASFVERTTIGLAGASQSGVNWLVEGIAGLFSDYVFLVGVEDENQRLAAENERLLSEAKDAKVFAVRNDELRRLLGFRSKRPDLRLAPASVVGRELSPAYRVSRMVVASQDDQGPAPDMAVVTGKGLVGRVVKTAGRYADVMLLTDSRSRVACEVLGKGVLGMLTGTGRPDEYRAVFQISTTEAVLDKDAVLVTSGHDRVFPRGLEVGYVADPEKRRAAGSFVEYDVALAVNPATVEEALVVTGAAAPVAP